MLRTPSRSGMFPPTTAVAQYRFIQTYPVVANFFPGADFNSANCKTVNGAGCEEHLGRLFTILRNYTCQYAEHALPSPPKCINKVFINCRSCKFLLHYCATKYHPLTDFNYAETGRKFCHYAQKWVVKNCEITP